jgi:hypothetical protein
MTFRFDIDMKLFDAVAKRSSEDDDSHPNVDQLAAVCDIQQYLLASGGHI